MASVLATNIISPLGMTTDENFQAVMSGKSALQSYSNKWNLPESFAASLFSDKQNKILAIDGYTRFESLVIHSIQNAISNSGLHFTLCSLRSTLFILSTTKGDIGTSPADSAQRIADYFGFAAKPIVVCNACISGLAAMILAERMLESEEYEMAIVCGADIQTDFTVSGFQSLKALSATECRPFDIERNGLNLGEAAATCILKRLPSNVKCLTQKSVSFVNAHGTATLYNDQMESVALERAGYTDVPVNSYKGVFGHTMGAAGILESIISMAAVDNGVILGTRGFKEIGVSRKINVQVDSNKGHFTENTCGFLKIISGFGGGNAALRFWKEGNEGWVINNGCIRNDAFHLTNPSKTGEGCFLAINDSVMVSRVSNFINVSSVKLSSSDNLAELYRKYIGDYPKFWKMDILSKIGFIASELLLQKENRVRFNDCNDRAIVLFNHCSCAATDDKYLATISDRQNFFPSPSLFIYTLPNIVTGEIAIRNHYHGETSFYILSERDEQIMNSILNATFRDSSITSILTGWIDCENENNFEAEFQLVNIE